MDMYERIDHELRKLGLSRRQLALKAEIPESTLSTAFMRKTKKLSIEYVQRIAQIIGVPWHELMGLEDLGGGVFGKEATIDSPIAKKFQKNIEHFHGTKAQRKKALLEHFNKLNDEGQETAIERVKELSMIEQYTEKQLP